MTNTYPIGPELEDETAEAMTRPPAPEPEPELEPEPRRKARRRIRNLFWPGFILGFIALGIASCGGIALATGINRIDLTQNGALVWTPPPTPMATPVSEETPNAEAPSVGEPGGAFAQGQRLTNITSSQVNIRAQPGYLSKPAGDVIAQVPPNGAVEVIGGRTFADGLTWWYIRYTAPDGVATDGWIAEATASGVQILGQ